MKVGIFGSEYQIERQNLIKRLFEKLREQEADIYVSLFSSTVIPYCKEKIVSSSPFISSNLKSPYLAVR